MQGGFDNVVRVVPMLAGIRSSQASVDARSALRLLLNENDQEPEADSKLRAARIEPSRVVDASTGGLGLAIRRADATWAKHGMLLAVLIEPGKDWFVGVLRRIFSIDDELRLGIQILAPKPRKVLLYAPATRDNLVWEEAIATEKNFAENFRYGILLEPQGLPLQRPTCCCRPAWRRQGAQFDLPLAGGQQRLVDRAPARGQRVLPARAVRTAGRFARLARRERREKNVDCPRFS